MHSGGITHPANLPVPALMDGYQQIRFVSLRLSQGYFWCPDGIAIQSDRLPEFLLSAGYIPCDPDSLGLFHLMLWMHQVICEITVIGKQKKPLRVHIQPSHGINPDPTL